MSNKIVPAIYRAVIDDVINAIKPEFDEYGVPEDVLAELQHKWESKVIASHVAEFENPAQTVAPPSTTHPSLTTATQQHHHAYPPHPMHMMPSHPHYAPPHNPYAPITAPPTQPIVKTEPVDNRYMLNPGASYALPPLANPTLNGSRQLPPPVASPPNPGGQTGVINFPRNGQAQAAASTVRAYAQPAQTSATQQQQRIPQVDGPSESSGDEDSPSPPPSGAFAPRASHPSLPQPAPPPQPLTQDSEAINSDLDDTDSEGGDSEEEGGAGETDIVFCTYDKVARVKNKWKCVLKDGMIHINGKDYLFAKCTGEFEW